MQFFLYPTHSRVLVSFCPAEESPAVLRGERRAEYVAGDSDGDVRALLLSLLQLLLFRRSGSQFPRLPEDLAPSSIGSIFRYLL